MDESKYSDTKKHQKVHPYDRANLITKWFFCWMFPFFVKGYKRGLNEGDLYGVLEVHESNRLGNKLVESWNYEVNYKNNPSLWRTIFRVFKLELCLSLIGLLFLEFVPKLVYPLLLSRFLTFFEPNQTSMDIDEAYIYAGLLVLSTFIQVSVSHAYIIYTLNLGMRIKLALSSLIYGKTLKLSKSALAEITVGHMVNLLSNDVENFEYIFLFINYLWLSPIETAIVMYVIYSYVGFTGLVGISFILLFTPFQIYISKKTSDYQLSKSLRKDERIRLMSEIITGIQVIKMYTWEKPFAKLVEIIRREEIHYIKAASVIRAIMTSFNLVLNGTAIYLCVITYVLTGNTINASYVYTLSSFYGIVRDSITYNFPKGLSHIAEACVSEKRIQTFLLCDELKSTDNAADVNKVLPETCPNEFNDVLSTNHKSKIIGVTLKNVSVKWVSSLPENILNKVSFKATSNNLVAVVGPVGSGKTTLLNIILKELIPTEGSVDVVGTLSYASQESWLFGGSVRQNIIFGQEFKQRKYTEVVRVCALERDFALFPHGDHSLVGERGVMLSGGQKARINLARAIYKDADIYLLDDPLSAVDTRVGKQLFDQCICGYLKEKCVVLVTHQLQYLTSVETNYLLENGRVTACGSFNELQTSDTEFTKLLKNEDEEGESSKTSREIYDKKEMESSEQQEHPQEEKEQRGSGIISWEVYKTYFKAGGNLFKTVIVLLSFVMVQILASSMDYFISIWINVEQWRKENNALSCVAISKNRNCTSDTYVQNSLQYMLSVILTDQNSIIIYSSIVLMTVIVTASRSIYFFKCCITASTRLHKLMFNKVVYAKMIFFNNNPSGRILNRFSKDIGIIDETLPVTILDTVDIGLKVLAISLIIGSLNPWTLLPILVILVIFYCLRTIYVSTSGDIKRIESVRRSPIYTHLLASIRGITTIRAFRAEEILRHEFANYQNKHSAVYFIHLAANRTFGFWLDFHCIIYTSFVIISILFVEKEIFGANVGLSLTQSVTLTTMLQWGIRQWSDLETEMTCVERVQEYIDLEPEKTGKTIDPPTSWPENGNIEFRNLYLRYSLEDRYVLENLSFQIKGKEKIGIVGRTGAGKSSLITALFRLTSIGGKILIDNINTQEVSLATLRSKISIIPQEPMLFSGTLRKNLDPFDEYNDDELLDALSEVELKNAVSNLPAGLESKISEGGSNFSVGQRQLLCLARAIIRNNKILVLDEATANVDPHTDELIQKTIRRKFAECTVLTVAHRLYTIMDSDKVLVMDEGRIVEFEHPYTLLQNPNGVFYGLVTQTGKTTKENLKAVAEQHYKKNI